MSYEDKILNFLAKPENINIAFQVAEYVQKLKEETHQQFWPMFSEVMSNHISGSKFEDSWKYVPIPPEKWDENWGKCGIQPAESQYSEKPFLQVAFGQGYPSKDYRLFMGVFWTPPETPKDINSGLFDQLVDQLKILGLKKDDNKWPGWNWLQDEIRSEDFVMRIHNEPQVLMDEISEIYWDFFLKIHPYVQAVNEAFEK